MNGYVIPQMKGIKEWNYIFKVITNKKLFWTSGAHIFAPFKKGAPGNGSIQDVDMNGHVIPQMKGIKEWNYILKIITNIKLFWTLGTHFSPLKKGGPRKRVKSRC